MILILFLASASGHADTSEVGSKLQKAMDDVRRGVGSASPALGDLDGPWSRPSESCTIIPCEPNALVAEIHDGRPVILPPQGQTAWMSREMPLD